MQGVVGDLQVAGYVERTRVGRRNRYAVHPDRPVPHPVEAGRSVPELVEALTPVPEREPAR